MAQTTLIITILLLFISLTVHTVKRTSVTVIPTDSDPSICANKTTCDTLSNLIMKNQNIFRVREYSFFQFLPGIHKVNVTSTELTIQRKGKLSWYGNETRDTVIKCESPLAFVFQKINFSMKYLHFSACGHHINHIRTDYSSNQPVSSTLFFLNTKSFQMEFIFIFQSRGYSVVGLNLRGCNVITSCHFVNNNPNCLAADCIGGGTAFFFDEKQHNKMRRYKRRKKGKNKVHELTVIHLSIIKSTFHNGADFSNSSKPYSCPTLSDTQPLFKANGLLIISQQQDNVIMVNITKSRFTENTRNPRYPAVWIHIHLYEEVKNYNRFIFENCRFEREGTVRISKKGKKKRKFKKVKCVDITTGRIKCPDPLIQLNNCSFTNSSHTALEICVATLKRKQIQNVLITKCIFQHYNEEENGSIVKINSHTSSTIIEMVNSYFISNSITAPIQLFHQLAGKQFLHGLINAIVQIKGPAMSHIRVSISACTFRNNTASQSKGILQIENIQLNLSNSTFNLSVGTALYALQSLIYIKGFNSFTRNHGILGGAMNLNLSRIEVRDSSHTVITNNSALYGGGIFAVANFTESVQCTISKKSHISSRIVLAGNKANYSGHTIFGGTYRDCPFVCSKTKCISNSLFIEILAKSGSDIINSDIVCPPTKLCICENGVSRCNKTSITLKAFPGQVFTVPLVAESELNVAMKAVVVGTMCKHHPKNNYACKKDYRNDIGYGQRMQKLNQECTNLTYTVSGQFKVSIELEINYDETMSVYEGTELFSTKKLPEKEKTRVFVEVNLLKCPVGFELKESNKDGQPSGCNCLSYFLSQKIVCNVNDGTVVKPQNKWIFSDRGMSKEILPALVNRTVIHNSCPYDYCFHEEKSVDLSKPDEQCNFKRGGVLCGACPASLSVVLGSSNCEKCSNEYLLLIIPFALAGVALVVLLLKCNLTVSVGHINGIIFYANILQINKALLFTNQKRADDIFSTFIAWLNLDLGIETCFFENMDSYAKVWLQFVFPVYVWILIAFIIFLANYSSRMGRLIGSNSVPVLASLFLLSYAKLLRTIIAAVSFTFIEFEDGSDITVWLRDGNIEYFNTKHAVLFFTALIFTFLFILPLTLLVLLAPCLQARSHYKAFRWVNRLKPFLDAYQGPYSKNFRYWTGLLLVLRIVLFVIDAANYENDPSMSFYCTVTILCPVAMICLLKRNVYRHKFANYVETLSLLNIVILYSVNWLTMTTNYEKWQPIKMYATYFSVTLMMVAFTGVVLYKAFVKLALKFKTPKRETQARANQDLVVGEAQMSAKAPVTCSVVELEHLKEPLLDSE